MDGQNVGKSPVTVLHASLERVSPDSAFKSKCPCCPDGILLMRRNTKTMELDAIDFCVRCGQAVIYSDIDTLKTRGTA